ncbi:hypothetical protein ACFV6U_09195 [Streptomyces sp. NPDC059810]|uniref:hypothetical protein n=1 Tax=Streptomyces sp. NPDC059810 TaxID=3346956 RepID=UPI00364F2212
MSGEFSNFFEAVRNYRTWGLSADLPSGWSKKPGPAHALAGLDRCANVNCRKSLGSHPTVMLTYTHENRFCTPDHIDADVWTGHLADHMFWHVRDEATRREQSVYHNVLDCAYCVQDAVRQG